MHESTPLQQPVQGELQPKAILLNFCKPEQLLIERLLCAHHPTAPKRCHARGHAKLKPPDIEFR